ncbi:MAG: toll/interleukin-1 receptor domain-containing protein [Candidatus Cybelea sp.]
MDYLYDLFISYKRDGYSGLWVQNHFYPALEGWLVQELGTASIAFDQIQEPGKKWPEELRERLLHSRLLVCIWSAPYFRSDWCLAEWKSMAAREELFKGTLPSPLIYPIVYADGEHFPPEAKTTSAEVDLHEYGYPNVEFSRTPEYLRFHDKVKIIAQKLARRISQVPPWEAGWPVVDITRLPVPPPMDKPQQ